MKGVGNACSWSFFSFSSSNSLDPSYVPDHRTASSVSNDGTLPFLRSSTEAAIPHLSTHTFSTSTRANNVPVIAPVTREIASMAAMTTAALVGMYEPGELAEEPRGVAGPTTFQARLGLAHDVGRLNAFALLSTAFLTICWLVFLNSGPFSFPADREVSTCSLLNRLLTLLFLRRASLRAERSTWSGKGEDRVRAGLGYEAGVLTCGRQVHHRLLDPCGRAAVVGRRVRLGCLLRCVWSAMDCSGRTRYGGLELRRLRTRGLDNASARSTATLRCECVSFESV